MGVKLRAGAPDRRFTMIQHMDERGTWATQRRRILFSPAGDETWQQTAVFPAALPVDLAGVSRLARRALRLDRCNVYPTRSGKLLGIRQGTVYRIEGCDMIPLFKIRGDSVMSRAIAETESGEVYFGEYFANPQRIPVRVWRIDPDLEHFEVARELESPRVRHVHGIHVDPYSESRLWITSGDFEKECYLGCTDDGFRNVEFIGDGSQLWRMVGLIFQENRICWMTDSHITQKHIVSMDRSTHETTIHGERDASSLYHAATTDGYYLATSCVEPGPAIQTNRCRLMASENATEWTTLAQFEKDAVPFPLFGFGFLSLPTGRFSSKHFWLTGNGLKELNDASQLCSAQWSENET